MSIKHYSSCLTLEHIKLKDEIEEEIEEETDEEIKETDYFQE
ncbi:9632_t:CDS:2 [Cetraspora pellucida]|uniref:9632_t:CDS:1 n=1 Tax=Cetraspora pellucida TaxID=1433469 RepID=A0ACA9JX48_9GLOM|nr:9632_t:CDS:2 [Cetraspora pellucida]